MENIGTSSHPEKALAEHRFQQALLHVHCMIICREAITLSLLGYSADNHCKLFEPRSGLTKRSTWSRSDGTPERIFRKYYISAVF